MLQAGFWRQFPPFARLAPTSPASEWWWRHLRTVARLILATFSSTTHEMPGFPDLSSAASGKQGPGLGVFSWLFSTSCSPGIRGDPRKSVIWSFPLWRNKLHWAVGRQISVKCGTSEPEEVKLEHNSSQQRTLGKHYVLWLTHQKVWVLESARAEIMTILNSKNIQFSVWKCTLGWGVIRRAQEF